MEIYQNKWRDRNDGKEFFDELHFSESFLYNSSLINAIEDYNATDQKRFIYMHTMVSDPEMGTCRIIDIQEEMYGYASLVRSKEENDLDRWYIERGDNV